MTSNTSSATYNYGGGIYTTRPTHIVNSTISNNVAGDGSVSNSYAAGGGIYATGAMYVMDSTISGNTIGEGDGGGIYSTGSLIVSGSTISENRSTGSFTTGDGIYSTTGKLQVTDSVISGNYGDGIDIFRASSPLPTGPCFIANSVFVGNQDHGIDITLASGGTVVVTNSTVAGNGRGISCSPPLTLTNSIVALNSSSSVPTLTPESSNNLINVDPLFVANPSDGGDGWGDDPKTPDYDESANNDYGDLRLRPGSPAIDAGSNALAVDANGNPLATDLDGNDRVQFGTVDIGAYEYDGTCAVPDEYTINTGETAFLDDPLANDVLPAGAMVEILCIDGPRLGTAMGGPTGIVSYSPFYAFSYTDTFRYQWIVDGVPSKTADVTIHVVGSGPILVSTANDAPDGDFSPGNLSLREALVVAAWNPGNDAIGFDPALTGQTIVLEQGQLALDSNVAIEGPAGGVTIDANHQSRVFYMVDGSQVSLENLTLTGGAATYGGGIYFGSGRLSIANAVIVGNTAAKWGGGIGHDEHASSPRSLSITNSTITGNSAGSLGGGLFNLAGTAVANSIIALNTAPSGANVFPNLGATSSNNLIGVDPGFVRNPSAGADGKWGTADDDLGDLHLRHDSPALNAGSNALAVDASGNPLTTDLDGGDRIIYGTVDIGAYEYHGISAAADHYAIAAGRARGVRRLGQRHVSSRRDRHGRDRGRACLRHNFGQPRRHGPLLAVLWFQLRRHVPLSDARRRPTVGNRRGDHHDDRRGPHPRFHGNR